jgi:hypothetical protein
VADGGPRKADGRLVPRRGYQRVQPARPTHPPRLSPRVRDRPQSPQTGSDRSSRTSLRGPSPLTQRSSRALLRAEEGTRNPDLPLTGRQVLGAQCGLVEGLLFECHLPPRVPPRVPVSRRGAKPVAQWVDPRRVPRDVFRERLISSKRSWNIRHPALLEGHRNCNAVLAEAVRTMRQRAESDRPVRRARHWAVGRVAWGGLPRRTSGGRALVARTCRPGP